MLNRYPFVDKLKQLFREEVMNVHQHVLPTTIIGVSNVSVLITQTMNTSIVHIVIRVNYQTT
jgi:hypothetical protein